MKKIIFLCLTFIVVSTGAFAIPGPGAPEKVKESFYHNFPQIEHPLFFDLDGCYAVCFKKDNNASEKVYLDSAGEIITIIKYYKEDELEPFIRVKINKKYRGKAIFGISEIQSNNEHYYRIVLEDDKNLVIVKSDAMGASFIEKKFKKG